MTSHFPLVTLAITDPGGIIAMLVILGIVALLIVPGILAERREIKAKKKEAEWRPALPSADFMNRLEELAYFKYVTPEMRASFLAAIEREYKKGYFFPNATEFGADSSPDLKYLFCDAEQLAEAGGWATYLEELEPFMKARGFDFHYEVEDLDHWEMPIRINGVSYDLEPSKKERQGSWDFALRKFAVILNDFLKSRGSEERIYGMHEGSFIFLTQAQCAFFASVFKGEPDFRWNIPRAYRESGGLKKG